MPLGLGLVSSSAAALEPLHTGNLIPGLPEDLARECLVRLGFDQLPAARRVSRGWKAEVESPFHHRLRRPHPHLALAQARPLLAGSGLARKYAAAGGYSYRLVLHDPAAGTGHRCPLSPARGRGGRPPAVLPARRGHPSRCDQTMDEHELLLADSIISQQLLMER